MSDQDRFHAEVTSEQEWRESLEEKHPSLRAWPGRKEVMSVYKKLNVARERFHALPLKKTGHNKFAGYNYFELGDFLIPALQVFRDVGLCAYVSFDKDMATMSIVDLESAERMEIKSPMGSANLKGCHEVQNIGAVETYQRRYLWVAALEIVEHDALDATTGSDAGKTASVRHAVRDGIGEDLPDDWKAYLSDMAAECSELVKDGQSHVAAQRIAQGKLDSEQRTYLENKMDSKTRAAIKQAEQEIRKALSARPTEKA